MEVILRDSLLSQVCSPNISIVASWLFLFNFSITFRTSLSSIPATYFLENMLTRDLGSRGKTKTIALLKMLGVQIVKVLNLV